MCICVRDGERDRENQDRLHIEFLSIEHVHNYGVAETCAGTYAGTCVVLTTPIAITASKCGPHTYHIYGQA